ncbi:MAG: hypothetical protein M5R36_25980 [Deltaproteobacteria bacterium]|nr:hypothetical protein [Deltaproteobacteria bacterium]
MMLGFCKDKGFVEKIAIPKADMPRAKEVAAPEAEPAEAAE